MANYEYLVYVSSTPERPGWHASTHRSKDAALRRSRAEARKHGASEVAYRFWGVSGPEACIIARYHA